MKARGERSHDGRLIRFLLRLYPAEFRARYGRAMLEFHRERLAEATASPVTWARIVVDHFTAASLEWIGSLLGDVRYSLRSLRRSPSFAVVAIGTMALGIGATTTLFGVFHAVLLKGMPYSDPDRLVYLGERVERTGRRIAVAPANFLDWQRQATSFEMMAAAGEFFPVLRGDGEPERLLGARVSASYFEVLGARAARGRTFIAEEDRPTGPAVVILSHRLWARRFGSDPSIIGRTIHLDDEPCTVIGIMPNGFAAPSSPSRMQAADVWRPYAFAYGAADDRSLHLLTVIARLSAETPLERAREEMDVVAERLAAAYPGANGGMGVVVQPMHDRLVSNARLPITILFGAGCLTLLIACVNVAGLLAARGRARYVEMATRRALGASRARIVRQLLIESVLLAALGGAGGVLLAYILIPAIAAVSPWSFPFLSSIRMTAPVLLFAALACAVTGIIVGLVPALRTANADLSGELATSVRGANAAGKIRGGAVLIVAEVALAVILLTGARLLIGSYINVTRMDLGFEPDDVTVVDIRLAQDLYAIPPASAPGSETGNGTWRVAARQPQFVDEFIDRARQIPGVIDAGAITALPATNSAVRGEVSTREAGDVPPDQPSMWGWFRPVSGNYFETMRIPLLAGRRFTPADAQEHRDVAIIDEALARKLWPSGNPLGETIILSWNRSLRVVGVVGSVRMMDFSRLALSAAVAEDDQFYPNTVYLPWQPQAETYTVASIRNQMVVRFVVRSAADASFPGADLLRVVRELDQVSVVSVQPLTRYLGGSMREQRFLAQLLAAFGILGLMLAVTGVYGVVAYSVTRRVREIGIRMALGARQGEVLSLFVTYVLRHAAIGLALGIAAALALGRVLSGFLYGITPRDPGALLSAAALLLVATALAAWIPSRRATRLDVVTTLRTDVT